MKKLGDILFSMATAVLLMSVFAIAIAWATFYENSFGTEAAKKMVYVAPWFEILLGLIAFNIMGNVVKYKLANRKKWTILFFHVAFVFILAGGAITRFWGYEGSMHIREGQSSDFILLSNTYLTMEAEYKGLKKEVSKKIRLTSVGSNVYHESLEIGGRKVSLVSELYMPSVKKMLVETANGSPAVSLFVMDKAKAGFEHDLLLGEIADVDDRVFSFNAEKPGNITFLLVNDVASFVSTDTVLQTGMMTRDTVVMLPGQPYPLAEKTMYRTAGQVFVVKSVFKSAEKSMVIDPKSQSDAEGLVVSLTSENASARLNLLNNGGQSVASSAQLDDIDVKVYFGSKTKQLPFSLALKDFVLERYPGSNSPSSYASEVVLSDPSSNAEIPYRIFMNNTLKYKGYRFFQSSYDRDERGTILSVSHDYWGMFVSYLGYLLMGIGMVLTLMNKNSRLRLLLRQSAELSKKKRMGTLLVLFALLLPLASVDAQNVKVSKSEHIKMMNTLLVQDKNGRLEPFSSMASEILRKLYRKEQFNGMSATEVLLGMQYNPMQWQQEPILKISNSKLASDLGAASGYVSYMQLFKNGKYILQQLVDETYHKEPNKRNKYDKEILNLDERVNICYQIYSGNFFKFFPIPDDKKFMWTTAFVFPQSKLSPSENTPGLLYSEYLKQVAEASSTNNYNEANNALSQIILFQNTYGKDILPTAAKVKSEVFYSKANIFGKLSKIYLLVGLVLLFIHLLAIFKPKWSLKGVYLGGFITGSLLFLVYTIGIALRWYISGHAPWSNGYETIVFVGWATALAGIVFARNSGITLAVTNLLAGIMLMVASMSWMNPEITPLVPVLKSYWLIVHVAIITSSYGFLAIGAFLGLLNLCLIIFRNKKNNKRVSLNIKEITIVIEISLIIGLMLLTVGSFLGGIWANESWGRYWGWDPKETWALVTVLVYAVVLHLRKIPGMNHATLFNSLALISFSSVLMTFFGVNYYLSGLHSYAQGDTPPVPGAVYVAGVIIAAIIAFAYLAEKRKPIDS